MYGQPYFYGKILMVDGGILLNQDGFLKRSRPVIFKGEHMETSACSRSNPYSPRTSSNNTRTRHKTVKQEPSSSTDHFNGCTTLALFLQYDLPQYGEKYFGDYQDGGYYLQY